MTKEKFLEELRIELENEDLSLQMIEDTIKEYAAMIDDALDGGETVASFVKRMGTPRKVAAALATQYPKKEKRIVAIMPFLTTIIFFLLGYLFNAWHPGWLVFLLIPMTSIITRKQINKNAFIFLVILTIFILSGTLLSAWAPAWSLFLLMIPLNRKERTKSIQLYAGIYTVLAVVAYHVLYTIIVFQTFNMDINLFPFINYENRVLFLNLLLLLFLPVLIYGLFSGIIQINGDFSIRFDGDNKQNFKKLLLNLTFILTVITGYVVLGIYTGLWHPGWLILLFIPIGYTFFKAKKFRLKELVFFLVTFLFVLGGEYISIPGQDSGYVISWLFFLLIPIFNILSSREKE